MYKIEESTLTLEEIKEAREIVMRSELKVRRTPCFSVKKGEDICLFSEAETLQTTDWSEIWLKCENMQNTGSFKIRGVASQFARAGQYFRDQNIGTPDLVTMSAGGTF